MSTNGKSAPPRSPAAERPDAEGAAGSPGLSAIVLSAGHGTRMKSDRPKVVHELCGRPMVYYPVRAALELGATEVVVVVSESARAAIEGVLSEHLPGRQLRYATQPRALGTGDAARVGMSALEGTGTVLVLCGDTPLLAAGDLLPLLEEHRSGAALALLSFLAPDPTGYGRVLRRADGTVREIREHRDLATDEERAVRECNAGVYLADRAALVEALGRLEPNNHQGEYYLTDVVADIARTQRVVNCTGSREALAGVNDRAQLADAEGVLYARIRRKLGQDGVSVTGAPLVDDTVEVEPGARLEDGVRLRGRTRIGARTLLDVGVIVEDSTLGADVHVKPYSVITQSRVAPRAQLGPFAHLRPESEVEEDAHVGNFVELKKSRLGRGAKANHLAYIGDADVGERSNLGAGTIVCNYDGFQKRRTTIGRGVFVGSDSQLIAPVTIGDGAYVATGTTVHLDVPPDALAIGRSRQQNKPGYAPPLRARLEAEARAAKERARLEAEARAADGSGAGTDPSAPKR